MVDDSNKMKRRNALKQLGVAGATLTSVIGLGTARQSTTDNGVVPKGLAKKAAIKKKRQLAKTAEFSDWANATLATPETFYQRVQHSQGTKYEKTAYVFPIIDSESSRGYITTAARKDWTPILEYSRGTPPQYTTGTAQTEAQKRGKKHTGRLLYRGGVTYDYELTDRTAVRLKGQHGADLPDPVPQPTLNFDTTTSAKQWQRVSSDSSFSTASFPNSVIIQDVPGYCVDYSGGSDKKGSNQYPDYLGNADDYYHDYDGCAPYAGAMVLGYHEGITVYDWNARNRLIDKMHYHMDTGNDIDTHIDDIAPGINEYEDTNTDYLYDARTDKSFAKSSLKDELYSGRPALLTMWDGGSPEEDGYQTYGNHTVGVEGYEERTDGLYWAIHDSYEYQRHWIADNNWNDADATYVEKI